MAEEQKPVEVVQEQIAAAVAPEAPAVETADVKTTEETKPVEAAAEAAAPAEEKKEVKPVEEGHLGHKAQGAAFPKNLIASKQFFFFGNDALEAKALEAYKKSEKAAESALNNIAWAAHTGKGLLFAGDKKAPTHVINLAHATEPETEGSNKFVLTANGSKHSFKAANAAERDNWVAQIKAKIAEAKELAASVTESDVYKSTLESFKPAPKEEKATEAAKEEATEEAKPEDAAAVAAPAEETQAAKEEPKRRSASRKRASIFGFGKKDVLPKDEAKAEEAAPAVAAEETAAATEEAAAPATEAAAATEEPAAAAEEATEAPKPNKRNSFFGGLLAKKEKKAAEPKAAEEAAEGEAAVTEDAPVIPPVETSTPLADAVNNAETAVNDTAADAKKDIKEKRKSSLPFAFGKRDKSPVAAAEGEEKPASKSAFSKLRATIKGKGASKADAAAAAETVKEEGAAAAETATETAEKATEEASTAIDNAAATASDAVENAPEKLNNATPAVTAAA